MSSRDRRESAVDIATGPPRTSLTNPGARQRRGTATDHPAARTVGAQRRPPSSCPESGAPSARLPAPQRGGRRLSSSAHHPANTARPREPQQPPTLLDRRTTALPRYRPLPTATDRYRPLPTATRSPPLTPTLGYVRRFPFIARFRSRLDRRVQQVNASRSAFAQDGCAASVRPVPAIRLAPRRADTAPRGTRRGQSRTRPWLLRGDHRG